jgi:hypothetical protein
MITAYAFVLGIRGVQKHLLISSAAGWSCFYAPEKPLLKSSTFGSRSACQLCEVTPAPEARAHIKNLLSFAFQVGYIPLTPRTGSHGPKRRGTQKEKGRVCKALFDGSIPSRASNMLWFSRADSSL